MIIFQVIQMKANSDRIKHLKMLMMRYRPYKPTILSQDFKGFCLFWAA